MAKYSDAVRFRLDWIKENYGSVLISAQDAQNMFLGTSEAKVEDLTDTQLLQMALVMADDRVRELQNTVSGMETMLQKYRGGGNRAQRRHSK